MPYLIKTNRFNKKQVKILIDSGASKNYCAMGVIPTGRIELKTPAKVTSIHGSSQTDFYFRAKLFGNELVFYELMELDHCDLILGLEGLKAINAKIDFRDNILTYDKVKPKFRINFVINSEVKHDYKAKIISLINKCITNKNLPYNTQVEATIRTENENPVWSKSYPYPFSLTNFVNNEIQKLLKNGIIQRSNSPYNAPILIVNKKGLDENGEPKHRLVIDFRKLNAITIADRYPIPEINVVLSNLGKSKYFTTIDLESGFHQIKIRPEDREKPAFSINNSKYEFIRMPFGLKNAPSIFQRALDDIMREFIGKFVHVYIDDILIYSQTEEEHFGHIKMVLNKLREANMAISSEKANFLKER